MRNPHLIHDLYSRESHRFLCERLRLYPAGLQEMDALLERWITMGNTPGTHIYFQQWKAAIAQGVEAVVKLSMDSTDMGQLLRSCSPICALWQGQERKIFFREFRTWYKAHPEGQDGKPPFRTSLTAENFRKNLDEPGKKHRQALLALLPHE